MEWLTTHPSSSFPESERNEKDFSVLNNKFQGMQPDIFAFQEVDSKQAVEKVVGSSYHIYMSDRAQSRYKKQQFKDINQYTGLAISEQWQVTDPKDIELSPHSKLRFATYVVMKKDNQPDVHVLSVHLKQGCPAQKKSSQSCKEVDSQSKVLNKWMTERVKQDQAFVIMGDFNHDMSYRNDWLWKQLSSGIESDVTLLTQNIKANCEVKSNRNPNKLYRYPKVIDHMIVSKAQVQSPAKQINYTRDEALNYRVSDHCPLMSTVKLSD
ncbi:MAG: endonuclease/exonuclease/phosphatase family protein [Vibrio sp.]